MLMVHGGSWVIRRMTDDDFHVGKTMAFMPAIWEWLPPIENGWIVGMGSNRWIGLREN